MKTKVGFIGFGLIAGSLAHALKESGRDYHITATSRHLEPVIAAVADGIVDVAAPAVDETFAQCDIILLCTPVITITEYLTKLKVGRGVPALCGALPELEVHCAACPLCAFRLGEQPEGVHVV